MQTRTLRRELVRGWRAVEALDLETAQSIVAGIGLTSSSAQVLLASIYALTDDAPAATDMAALALSGPLDGSLRCLAGTIHRYGSWRSFGNGAASAPPSDPSVSAPRSAFDTGKALELCIDAAEALRNLRLAPAKWIATEALQLAGKKAGAANAPARFAMAILARIAYEDGDLVRAQEIIERIRQRSAGCVPLECLTALYPMMAGMARSHGNVALAGRYLAEGQRVGTDRGGLRLLAVCLREHVELLAGEGDLTGAHECLNRLMLLEETVAGCGSLHTAVTMERALADARLDATTDPAHAKTGLVRELYAAALKRRDAHGGAQIGIRLVDALHRRGNAPEALQLLVDLLSLAVNTGLFQTFIDGGAEMHALLRTMQGRANEFGQDVELLVRLLIRRLDTRTNPPITARREPDHRLTVRERSVLQLIGQGHSNKQIARELRIAPETVKSFAKHIFVKLGTRTRAESVACAARLGLFS